ncbi:MAG: T9SS type A sorting domain-containing protein [Bacteroidia bacterium]|nr:T9SS type A sorting domain-containing protein [Bacteroidia bacterium]
MVYPNPSNGNITISSITNEVITNIIVSDITGRIVFNKSFDSELFEVNNDFSFLPASTYFISISTTNNVYIKKCIIVK